MSNRSGQVAMEHNTFISVPSMYEGFTDVYYNGQRVAIINGLSSPLQWTAKNGSNIPNNVIDELECLVSSFVNGYLFFRNINFSH